MIDTLSDASRLVLGAMDADREPASLGAIVRSAVDAFGAAARERVTVDAPRAERSSASGTPRSSSASSPTSSATR